MSRSPKLQIAFNSSCLHPDAIGGWARYTRSLIESLRQHHSGEVDVIEHWNKAGETHSVWEQRTLPRLAVAENADVLHAPANGGVPFNSNGIPTVMTVHDLFSEEDFSWLESLKSIDGFKRALRYKLDWWVSLRRCTKIIAVSEFTRGQLLNLGISPEKIAVVYEGVSSKIQYDPESFGGFTPNSYILYVGTSAPRKRVDHLVQQFGRAAHLGLKLIIVGPKSALEVASQPSVVYLSKLGDEQLAKLYSGALAFVTFSEKEGFGLPLIEAMACGTPVLFSGAGSIEEIVADGGLKIQEDGLVQALERLKVDAFRQGISRQAMKQALKFTWERCAAQTLEIYKTVRIDSTRSRATAR